MSFRGNAKIKWHRTFLIKEIKTKFYLHTILCIGGMVYVALKE